MPFVKQASDADVQVADRLLRQIHDENPSYWPHGLSRAHFDGGLYLLSKQAGMEPVGFVGWQERQERSRRIGYYSIGILPEHRRKEYAKRAVQAVLAEKSAGVDEVRAMVARHNEPSKQLAHSLSGVTLLEKDASWKSTLVKNLATALAGGSATMVQQDNMMHPDEPYNLQAFRPGENDKNRNGTNLVNFVLGAGGALAARKGLGLLRGTVGPAAAGMSATDRGAQMALGATFVGGGVTGMTAGPIFKDVGMHSHKAIEGVANLSKALPAAVRDAKPDTFKIPDSLVNGGLALGAVGLGTAALISILKMRERRREVEAARGGRIRVTLPTKNPGDSETTIDLPTEGFDMSAALQGKLKRDTRQRLLLETRQRTRHRKPKDPNNLTEAEAERIALDQEQAELDAELGKAAHHRLSIYFKQAHALGPYQQQVTRWERSTPASRLGPVPASEVSTAKAFGQSRLPGALSPSWKELYESLASDVTHEPDAAWKQARRLAKLLAALRMKKMAGTAAPAVPSPPAQGTNPALRMTQQAQAAQQMAQGASTDQNPQIIQAQQAASAAEQKAQQDVAAAQQQTQQESMKRDQAHAQELAKKDQETFQARQEIEIQKTEVEKAKVEMELAKAKMEAAQEIEDNKKSMTESLSKGDSSAVHRMNKQRLARIKSTLSKVAAQLPNIPRPFHDPIPPLNPGPAQLLPGTAQRINDRGNEFQAYGGLVRPHLYRTSYGRLGDMAYGNLVRPFLMTPSRDDSADWTSLSPETIAANPDAFDSMLRAGQQVMNAPR